MRRAWGPQTSRLLGWGESRMQQEHECTFWLKLLKRFEGGDKNAGWRRSRLLHLITEQYRDRLFPRQCQGEFALLVLFGQW